MAADKKEGLKNVVERLARESGHGDKVPEDINEVVKKGRAAEKKKKLSQAIPRSNTKKSAPDAEKIVPLKNKSESNFDKESDATAEKSNVVSLLKVIAIDLSDIVEIKKDILNKKNVDTLSRTVKEDPITTSKSVNNAGKPSVSKIKDFVKKHPLMIISGSLGLITASLASFPEAAEAAIRKEIEKPIEPLSDEELDKILKDVQAEAAERPVDATPVQPETPPPPQPTPVPEPKPETAPQASTATPIGRPSVAASKGTVSDYPRPGKGPRVTPSEVYAYLKNKGIKENQILGLMANIEAESGFEYGVRIKEFDKQGKYLGDSGGLFQLHRSRLVDLENKVPNWQTNWRGQIDFALKNESAPTYLEKNFDTPEAASIWWTVNWERPADRVKKAKERAAQARKFMPANRIAQVPKVGAKINESSRQLEQIDESMAVNHNTLIINAPRQEHNTIVVNR